CFSTQSWRSVAFTFWTTGATELSVRKTVFSALVRAETPETSQKPAVSRLVPPTTTPRKNTSRIPTQRPPSVHCCLGVPGMPLKRFKCSIGHQVIRGLRTSVKANEQLTRKLET